MSFHLETPSLLFPSLFTKQQQSTIVSRSVSLPNYSHIYYYDKEDESELSNVSARPYQNQLALPSRHQFQSLRGLSQRKDQYEDTSKPSIAIRVSLPMPSIAAASVAKSRRIKLIKAQMEPLIRPRRSF
ncbi:hypothetical protein G6F70_000168 [Rhizopus microsporus]|uniref:Uncharacterized protein n=2 Tax=Rhizopus TaxID=4842 RepID=A0A367JC99_RHIAZ|nr:hypothetical protein G6F71_001448 [Rhizopus microsporus]RCH87564.1 hypothetical protein CU097_007454 [Rhizopus azygosporus]KAG1204716.1 hypothetical protein G6F70_000168 [Rhizopus microsporus]KAG1216115.1 hypothetical protein G6F69_000435 [Rhizopus microsporus]KAG1237085.1 hypothetical protein G6F67_001503 [Rhizopus microsporus]